MFTNILIEFENVTKFKLLKYFEEYRDFMQNNYSYIELYYNGGTERIDSVHTVALNNLTKKSNVLLQQFISFSTKLSNCGFFELQQYCQDLNDVLIKITKLPKYNRVSLTKRGYKPYIQINSTIGGMKTLQDLSDEINFDGINEVSLILDNDLSEEDWEIDSLKKVNAFINNRLDVVVKNILEEPIGEKIYGRDITRKITIKDNDLSVELYKKNIEQKCDILLELNKGDVPEFSKMGKNLLTSKTVANYNYTELVKDLQSVFLQNDIFDSVEITNADFKNGDISVTCKIKTKYSYATTKILNI